MVLNRSQEGLEDVNLRQKLVPGGSGGAPNELQGPLMHALEGSLEQNNKTVVTASSTCVIADMPQVNFKKMIGDTNEK